MAAKDMQMELQALQKLYGLLKTDGDAMSNRISDLLDGNARFHLKKLLDEATQRTLKAHAKLIAGRMEASNSGIAPVMNESYGTGHSYEQKKKLSALAVSKEKGFNEQPSSRMGTTSGPENRKKRCRVCKSTVKQYFTSIEQPNFHSDERSNVNVSNNLSQKEQDKSENFLLNSESEIGSQSIDTAVDSNSEKGMQMVHEANNAQNSDVEYRERPVILNENSDAIQEIGLCISALHLLDQCSSAKPQNFVPAGVSLHLDLNRSAQNFIVDKNNMFYKFASQSIEEHDPHQPSKEMNFPFVYPAQPFVSGQPTNSMLQSATSQFIRSRDQDLGLKVSDETFVKPIEDPKLHDHKSSQNVKAMIDRIESGKWKEHQNESWNTTQRTFKPQKSSKNTKTDGNNSMNGEYSSPNRKGKTLPKTKRPIHKNEVPNHRKHESPSSSSRSYTSNNSINREYSSPNQSRMTESYSDTSPLSDGTRSVSSSFFTSSEDEVYSSTNGGVTSHGTPSINSSRNDTQAVQHQARSKYESTSTRASRGRIHKSGYESASTRAGPSRVHKSRYNTDRKRKTTGTWRMLKDKLGVFFHHHHHHHHHNLENDQEKNKSKRNIPFVSKGEAEAYGEKAVEKMVKSDKNHHTLQGLVGAALKHVRRSKKPRTDEKVRTLDKHHGGNKKGLKTSNWLKALKHHRKAELAKKKHEKQRKSHLKSLPTMK